MATYGDMFTQAKNAWDNQSEQQKMASLGYGYNEGNGYYNLANENYRPWAADGGDNASLAMQNWINQNTQFNAKDWFQQQGIQPTRTGYTQDGQSVDWQGNYDDSMSRAWRDKIAQSYNQFGFNFNNWEDMLRHQTGNGQFVDDATLGRLWVPDNKNYQTWNNDFSSAANYGAGDMITHALDQGAGVFALGAGIGALGLGAGLGGAAAGADTLGGGSFLAANDAAMAAAGTSALGTGGMYTGALAGDILGGGSFASMGGLGTFGLDSFNPLTGGLDFGSGVGNPFSLSGADPMAGLPTAGGNSIMPNQMPSWASGNAPIQTSPFEAAAPTAPSGGVPTGAAAGPGGVNPANMTIGDIAKKYGIDGAKALLNYFMNQKNSNDAEAMAGKSNPFNEPWRRPFIDEATRIANGQLGNGGEAIKAAVEAQANARYAKYGYGGTETSRADVMLAAELAKYGNDRLNALLGYTGFNQNTSQLTYQAFRDSLAFQTQSYQGFSALAGKIGADSGATKAITQAAVDLGSRVIEFFS